MSRLRRFVFASDVHGDEQDPKAVSVFFDFVKHWKPEIRVHGGDAFDFRYLRRGALPAEEREDVKSDFDMGIDFIKRLKPTHFLRGNHDERLWDRLNDDDGKVRDYAIRVADDICCALGSECQMLPYDKRAGVLRIGKLKMIHGYSSGVYAARLAAQVYGAVLLGHSHTIDAYSSPSLEQHTAYICGCLCKLDMQYNRAQLQTLRQAHGWAYGIIAPSGLYQVWQARNLDGEWYFPTEVVRIGA